MSKIFTLDSPVDSNLTEFKVFDPAGIDETDTLVEGHDTADSFGPLGIASRPASPDANGAVEAMVTDTNEFHVTGMRDTRLLEKFAALAEGETMLLTVKKTGGSFIVLRQSGIVEVNGGSDWVAMHTKTKAALDKIQSALTACGTAFVAINSVAPNSGQAGINSAMGGFTSDVKSSDLKAN